MATPRATNLEHRDFWAGTDPAEAQVTLIAQLAANLRASAAPEPASTDAEYDSRAASAELFVGQFVGQRGITKSAGAGGASVTFAEQDEALSMAARIMGDYAGGTATVETPLVTFTTVAYD